MTLRWLGEAKIGPNAPHAVQLTCLGPKKPILRPLVQNLIFSHGMTLLLLLLLLLQKKTVFDEGGCREAGGGKERRGKMV